MRRHLWLLMALAAYFGAGVAVLLASLIVAAFMPDTDQEANLLPALE